MRSLSLLVVGLIAACGPNVGDAEEQDGTGSESSTSTSGPTRPSTLDSTSVGPTTTQGPGTLDTGTSDTAPEQCELTEQFTCPDGVDCSQFECGDLMSPFDADGCLRPVCVNGGCPDGAVCFTPSEYGGCASSGQFCYEDLGQCLCGGDDDCGGSYCVPGGEAPPTFCGAFDDDETACIDAGCGPLVMGRPIIPIAGGSCICELDEMRCLWLQPFTEQTAGKTAYISTTGLPGVIVFDFLFVPPPIGYINCAASADPGCECAEVLPCAMD